MYPAAMTALRPMTVPTRWKPARVMAAVLCFAALVLVIASAFLPLYSGEMHVDNDFGEANRIEITYSPWSVEISPNQAGSDVVEVPKVGYPLVFAAVILAGAACACWYAATPSAGRTAGRASGSLMSTGVAFLIGTAWTTAVMVTSGVEYFDSLGAVGFGVETAGSYLVGYWLLLIAVLLGFAAVVLSLLPAREPVWQPPPPPVNPYLPTPPYGMALPRPIPYGQPVVHTLPPEPVPAPQGLTVDPLTGQPMAQGPASPPVGVPAAQPALGIDPVTGQTSPPTGLPAQPPTAVDPLTGQPIPYTGQNIVDPLTGQPLAPATPVPFTTAPVGQVNGHPGPGVQPTAAAEPPPIVVPDAPPPPEKPPGPAIPPTEDPLAEPPRTP
jgi:hypothetical protein